MKSRKKLTRHWLRSSARSWQRQDLAAVCLPFPLSWRESGTDAEARVVLSGRQVGQLTVIGRSDVHRDVWVVRCACGNYSLRPQDMLLEPSSTREACHACQQGARPDKPAGKAKASAGRLRS